MMLSFLGTVARECGEYDQARLLLEESISLLDDQRNPYWLKSAVRLLGLVARDNGEHAVALSLLSDSLRMSRDQGDRHTIAQIFEDLAPIMTVLGVPVRAVRLLSAAEMIRTAIAAAMAPSEAAAVKAAIAQARSSLSTEVFKVAWAAGGALTMERALAEALEPIKGDPAALPHLAGGRHNALASEKTLPSVGFDLTRREREILGLLAQRKTDAEIAEQLYITVKTTSNHVGNVLSKLGASNRREAAAIAARLALV
jgi:DNA-binding CsgD family transcriptional regulator